MSRVRWFSFLAPRSWEDRRRRRVRVPIPIEALEETPGLDARLIRRHPEPFSKRDRARRMGRKFVLAIKYGELSPG